MYAHCTGSRLSDINSQQEIKGNKNYESVTLISVLQEATGHWVIFYRHGDIRDT